MSIRLICDLCHQPKDSVRHYGLQAYWRDGTMPRHRVIGAMDLCDDCVAAHQHDGRDSAHKVDARAKARVGHQHGEPQRIVKPVVQRVEFGRVRR